MKNFNPSRTLGGPSARWTQCGMAVVAAVATLLAVAGAASAKPVISHDSVTTAVKGEPLGLRATVRDAAGRISSVSVFYASSRGMTPFRRDLSTTGAGIWFGTIPGHLIGPGSNLFYYVHADNIEGESTDTDWITVNVIEPGISAANMPTAQVIAQQAQRAASQAASSPAAASSTAAPAAHPATAPVAPSTPRSAAPRTAGTRSAAARPGAPVTASVPAAAAPSAQDGGESGTGRNKYLLPATLVVGGAAIIGGGIALANSGGGGGGSDDSSSSSSSSSSTTSGTNATTSATTTTTSTSTSTSTNTATSGNYGGNYSLCFEPAGTASNAVTHCDSGPVNLYVKSGSVQIVGLWGSEVLTATLNGSTYTAESQVSARGNFPAAHLIVAGEISGSTSSARIVGYSSDTTSPGNFTGNIGTTRR